MGEYSTPVFCIIFICVIILCESLPFIADKSPDTVNRQYSHVLKQNVKDNRQSIFNMENNHLKGYPTEQKELFLRRNLTRKALLHRNVILITKQLVSSYLRRSSPHKHAKNSNVIETSNNGVFKHTGHNLETIQIDRNQENSQFISTKNIVKDSATTQPGSTRNVPGHRKHRQRRSYLHDYGLALSYSDEEGDVIFGAHTSACAYTDRHYCLNGGTCVFVGALEIKTCQCKIGYTGLRCQSINEEFLMALLSDEFFG